MPKEIRTSSTLAAPSVLAALIVAGLIALLIPAQADAAPKRTRNPQTPDALYHNYCSVCHGDRGDGRSRATNSLVPPPRDFTTDSARQTLTREGMIQVVRDGRAGTAMTGWKRQLNEAQIVAVVDYVISTFMLPSGADNLKQGAAVYRANCAVCHGAQGEGSIGEAARQPGAARNFRSPKSAGELTRERMIASVKAGKPGTPMVGFAGRLSENDIQAVVDYVRVSFMMPATPGISGTHAHGSDKPGSADMSAPMPQGLKGDARKGRTFYDANCATCHGVKGDGQGPRAYFIRPKPRVFTDAAARTVLNRPALYAAVAEGRNGTEMPAWDKVIGAQQIADVSEYVFQAFIRPGGKAPAGAKSAR